VHRDLKPGNIMVARGGLVKVVDFGLAKPVAVAGARAPGEAPSSPLSSRGAVLGTSGYMSPEQVEGRDVDGRSDIFSFGAVLYEMVSGSPAFWGRHRRRKTRVHSSRRSAATGTAIRNGSKAVAASDPTLPEEESRRPVPERH